MAVKFQEPLAVFTSYSHGDGELREELRKHLTPLIRRRRIVEWHDQLLNAGDEWRGQIEARLETAHVVLLLVSPDFLHSEYCYDVEMKRALERERDGGLRVVPVLLREAYWKDEPFSRFQVLPRNGHPVCSSHWSSRDAAYLDVVQGVRALVAELVGEELPESSEPRETIEIELPVELDQFTAEYRDRFLDALVSTLKLTGRVHLVAVRRGSTVLTLELDRADAGLVVQAQRSGVLETLRLMHSKPGASLADSQLEVLVAAARRGDRSALERFVESCYERVERVVTGRLGPRLRERVDVGDVVQETIIAALRKLDDLEVRTEAQLIAWLASLAERTIADRADYHHAGKRDSAREEPLHDSERVSLVDDTEGPLETAMRDEQRALLNRCIAELPEEYRQLILLRDFAGDSWESIAASVGRPSADSAREMYLRARLNLLERLRDARSR
jgi:RNA polymerase sigma factor (sigma-70 family)